ncbi:MAG: glycosyltransferase family 2 protein [Candidatus Tumulicola sp.]
MTSACRPIVLCFAVIDEADVVEHFVEYHLSLGVDALVATDLGSTDGTLDVLKKYELQGILHLTRLASPELFDEHNGVDWVTTARAAFGAQWCLFADPDEFLVLPDGDAADYLSSAPAPIMGLPKYNVLPERGKTGKVKHFSEFSMLVRQPLEFHYDLKLKMRYQPSYDATVRALLSDYPPEILRAVQPKVVARADVIKSMVPGCHNVIPQDPATSYRREDRAYVAHFPVRSLAQFQRKAELVCDCIERTPPEYPNVAVAEHWVRLNALFRHNLVGEEFERQLLSDREIEAYMREGILQRDESLSHRLRELAITRRPEFA